MIGVLEVCLKRKRVLESKGDLRHLRSSAAIYVLGGQRRAARAETSQQSSNTLSPRLSG